MDFDRKQFIMQRIAQNGTMYQQIIMLQQQVLSLAQMVDPNMAAQMAAGMAGGAAPVPAAGGVSGAEGTEALGGSGKESSHTQKARQRVAESTSPT